MTTPTPSVSIVVPVLNEAAVIGACLTRLRRDFADCDLVVVDGGSTDRTVAIAAPLARVLCGQPGRAGQMNAGARATAGEVLWFVHADTTIAPEALVQLRAALADSDTVGGGLRLRFDTPGRGLRVLARMSNLRARWLHQVYGDQSMFVRRKVFDELGGFAPLPLMEDLDLSRRLHDRGRLVLIPATSTASTRRFEAHGTWPMVAFMQYLKLLYFFGVDPEQLRRRYEQGPPGRRRPGAGSAHNPSGDAVGGCPGSRGT